MQKTQDIQIVPSANGKVIGTDPKPLTWRQVAFVNWLATPKKQRDPKTQALLAEQVGVNACTLSRWAKQPDIMSAVMDAVRGLSHKALPEIYGILISEALTGSFQHIKLALELTGEFTQQSNVDLTVDTVSGSPEKCGSCQWLNQMEANIERGYGHYSDADWAEMLSEDNGK